MLTSNCYTAWKPAVSGKSFMRTAIHRSVNQSFRERDIDAV